MRVSMAARPGIRGAYCNQYWQKQFEWETVSCSIRPHLNSEQRSAAVVGNLHGWADQADSPLPPPSLPILPIRICASIYLSIQVPTRPGRPCPAGAVKGRGGLAGLLSPWEGPDRIMRCHAP